MHKSTEVIAGVVFSSAIITGCSSHPPNEVSAPHNTMLPLVESSRPAELAYAACHMRNLLPDPNCTPGAINPNVIQATIYQTICIRGFTKTIRPPVSYTNRLKAKQMREYGFTDSPHKHEEDHLISLELGGSPADPKNLWPEPGASPNMKDKVENFLHAAVCTGRISLQAAQQRIASNWTTAEQGISK